MATEPELPGDDSSIITSSHRPLISAINVSICGTYKSSNALTYVVVQLFIYLFLPSRISMATLQILCKANVKELANLQLELIIAFRWWQLVVGKSQKGEEK